MENVTTLPTELKEDILAFAKNFESFKPGSYESVKGWINNNDLEKIAAFLSHSSSDEKIDLTYSSLASMTFDELLYHYYNAKRIVSLEEKKNKIYARVLTFTLV